MARQNLKRLKCRIWGNLDIFTGRGKDLGVSAYLESLGFVPTEISILTYCSDFMHEHDGVIDDTRLRYEYSSEAGWNKSDQWTRKMVKDLVRHLKKRGITVYLSSMGFAYHPFYEKKSRWMMDHKEILLVHGHGGYHWLPQNKDKRFDGQMSYNIAARFKDGSYYDEFFAEQVTRTVLDYGFDGFHAADGYKCFVYGIMSAGFSRDMVEQFQDYTEKKLPFRLSGSWQKVVPRVSEWIWKKKRVQWIEFWRWRLSRSWTRVADTLTKAGKRFMINSSWGTDPLESVTRYGMDTKALEQAGARSVMYETMDCLALLGPVSGPPDSRNPEGYLLEGPEFTVSHRIAALLRAVHSPKMIVAPMIPLHDAFERCQYLKSGEAYVERHLIGNLQLYRFRRGRVESATALPNYCLPNFISHANWQSLESTQRLGESIFPSKIPGPIAVWSGSTVENEIGPSRKKWSVHRALYELSSAGCPVITGAQIEELGAVAGECLLWANPHSFDSEEQDELWRLAKRNRLVIFDPGGEFSIPRGMAALTIVDAHSGAKLMITGTKAALARNKKWLVNEAQSLRSRGLLKDLKVQGSTVRVTPKRRARPLEFHDSMEGHFMTRVPSKKISLEYLLLAAGIARIVSWPLLSEVRVENGPQAEELAGHRNGVYYIQTGDSSLYLIAENFHHHASFLKAQLSRRVKKIELLNLPIYQPEPVRGCISLALPSWGVSVTRVELET